MRPTCQSPSQRSPEERWGNCGKQFGGNQKLWIGNFCCKITQNPMENKNQKFWIDNFCCKIFSCKKWDVFCQCIFDWDMLAAKPCISHCFSDLHFYNAASFGINQNNLRMKVLGPKDPQTWQIGFCELYPYSVTTALQTVDILDASSPTLLFGLINFLLGCTNTTRMPSWSIYWVDLLTTSRSFGGTCPPGLG